MRRDELRQPLKKRGLAQQWWDRRPSALQAASLTAVVAFTLFAVWLVRTPYPNAGEPLVTLAIPPAEPIMTSSTSAPAAHTDIEPAPEDNDSGAEGAVLPQEAVGTDEVGERQDSNTETTIIIAPRRPLAPAPIASVI